MMEYESLYRRGDVVEQCLRKAFPDLGAVGRHPRGGSENQGGLHLGKNPDVSDLFLYLGSAGRIETLIERTQTLLKAVGITDCGHVNLSCRADLLDVIGTYPASVVGQFKRHELHLYDAAYNPLCNIRTGVFRSSIDHYVLSAPFDFDGFERHKECCAFLEKNGVLDAYCVPIAGGEVKSLFFCSSHFCAPMEFQRIVMAHREAIHNLAIAFHQVGSERLAAQFHNKRGNEWVLLTERERELLQLLAAKDLTLNEAAEVLSVSISTANQHIAAAKKKLRASTTHGALIAALGAGLIQA